MYVCIYEPIFHGVMMWHHTYTRGGKWRKIAKKLIDTVTKIPPSHGFQGLFDYSKKIIISSSFFISCMEAATFYFSALSCPGGNY
jgi:hypothetical protein